MGWKPGRWKLNLKEGKDRWLIILAVGLIFLILAFPTKDRSGRGILGGQTGAGKQGTDSLWTDTAQIQGGEGGGTADAAGNRQTAENGQAAGSGQTAESGQPAGSGQAAAGGGYVSGESGDEAVYTVSQGAATYEQQLESRLKELLSHVEGVGEVEVMIVLKSSEEKVWRTDRNSSLSSTKETDSNGGTRDVRSQEISEDTILTGSGGAEGPLLEKELKPEIGGVVVSAAGGGSPVVQAEISAAVEALFDVPSHKIKVLKRAE